MLAYGKRKAMLCQGGTTLNINHSAFGSVQKVGWLLPLNYHLRGPEFESTHLYHTKKLRLCLGFAYAKRLAWALIFLFFAPNVNAKAFSATFYFYNLIIFPTLCLPMASAKRCFARVAPPLTSITPPLAPFKRWGRGFTLKLSFKGAQIRVHSSLPLKLR